MTAQRRTRPPGRPDGDRPSHPMGASILLVVVVVALIVALAAASAFR